LAGNLKGKRPSGRHRHRWEDNIKINLSIIDGTVWIGQDGDCRQALVTMMMNLQVP
jgi:hypothetical protein